MSNKDKNMELEIEALSDGDLESVVGGRDDANTTGGTCNTTSGVCETSGSGTCNTSGNGTCNNKELASN